MLRSFKKPKLDPTSCQNVIPISHSSFMSKPLEHPISSQLLRYFQSSGLLPTHQSGFRGNHSTEPVHRSVLSDIYSVVDKSKVSFLSLFAVFADFDMVDHQIFLKRFETSFRINPF